MLWMVLKREQIYFKAKLYYNLSHDIFSKDL